MLIDEIENALLASRQETKRSNTNLLLSLNQAEELRMEETETALSQIPNNTLHHDYRQEEPTAHLMAEEQHLGLAMSMSQDSTLTTTSTLAASDVDALSLPDIQTNTTTSSEEEDEQEDVRLKTLSNDRNISERAAPLPLPQTSASVDNQSIGSSSGSEACLSLPDLGTNTTIDSTEVAVTPHDDDARIEKEQQQKYDDDLEEDIRKETKQAAAPCLEEMEHASSNALPPASSDHTSMDTSSSHTIVTEALSVADSDLDTTSTDITVVTMDSQQQQSDGMYFRNASHDDGCRPLDMDEQPDASRDHSIMPRQPEILRVPSMINSMDDDEEEKTEVDEYVHIIEDDDKIKDIAPPLQLPPDVEQGFTASDVQVIDESVHSVPPVIGNKRAEYVSATVLKLEASHDHGLEFMSVDGKLRIAHISATGLFAHSPLAPFDRMLRINNLNCETLDPVNAAHLLTHLKGAVTVIAQNQGGVSDLVESQITKPLSESQTGLVFGSKCIANGDDVTVLKDELEIIRIDSKSLFASALLHVGDRVIAVNDCRDLDTNMANALLQAAPKHCVILAKTKLKTQMAIARRPTHQLPPNFNFVRAMEEAQQQREELQRKQGCYYNSCERPGACANIFQWLGNVYVITIVIVGISISWNSVKEQTIDGSDAVGAILKFMGLFVGGILLGFLVNAPWWFRQVGARFSFAQLVCNAIVIASFFWFNEHH